MKCELFSIRSSEWEVEEVNRKTGKLLNALKERGISLLYKTEIDPNPTNLENALKSVSAGGEAPEMIIVANALGRDTRASFIALFDQAVSRLDRETGEETVVRTLSNLGNGMSAFFFTYRGINIVALPQTSACGRDIVTLALNAIEKAKQYIDDLPTPLPLPTAKPQPSVQKTQASPENSRTNNTPRANNNNMYDDKYEGKTIKKKKKKGFFASVFPQRGDKAGTVISKILVIVFVLVFLVAAYLLIDDVFIKSIQHESKSKSLIDIFYNDSAGNSVTPSNPYGDEFDEVDLRTKDWATLNAKYPDIKAWIRIKNLDKIDYPVLFSEKMDGIDYFYLYHDYEGVRTKYGSLFIDPNSGDGFNTGRATLIHGHHMRDGSMFASLVNYGEYSGNLETYQNSSVITVETPEGVTKWQIFAVVKTTVVLNDSSYFDYSYAQFPNDESFMEYVYKARVRSLFNVPIPVNENDKLLVLSTCSYEYNDFRTVLFARELRHGESSLLTTKNTTLNPRPLWPDVYHNSTGVSRPPVSNFETAYKNGEISWYDGNLYQ